VYSAQRSRALNIQRDLVNRSESGTVGTMLSSVIPKRSTSDDVEGCRVARARHFENTPGRD
jgi:hypothetical protein